MTTYPTAARRFTSQIEQCRIVVEDLHTQRLITGRQASRVLGDLDKIENKVGAMVVQS